MSLLLIVTAQILVNHLKVTVDTITHIALGACLGEILGGKQLGKKALVVGAFAQTFPDIDFVCALWMDPSSNVLAHRGLTHYIFFGVLIAVPAVVSVKP